MEVSSQSESESDSSETSSDSESEEASSEEDGKHLVIPTHLHHLNFYFNCYLLLKEDAPPLSVLVVTQRGRCFSFTVYSLFGMG